MIQRVYTVERLKDGLPPEHLTTTANPAVAATTAAGVSGRRAGVEDLIRRLDLRLAPTMRVKPDGPGWDTAQVTLELLDLDMEGD